MRAFVIAHHDARLRIRFSMCEKRLSEVGFEPTPTFVDQNTPVRKSSTLESGALDRSAILTCQLAKNNEALNRMHVDLCGNPKFDYNHGHNIWHTIHQF